MANLLAGAAMRVITPPEDLLKELATPREDYKGVHSDLYARVIVVSDGETKVALLGADMGIFPNTFKTEETLRRECGIAELGCIPSATHCHEAPKAAFIEGHDPDPGLMGGGVPTEAMDRYSQFMLDQYVAATQEAIANLRPARMGVARGESFINCSRDLPTPMGGVQSNNFKGTSDHELLVIKFEDRENGEPIGVWVNHATHSNYMCWNLYRGDYPMINSDLGGGISVFVEKALKCGRKAPVIWAIGAAGDQNPITRSSWRLVRVDDEGEYNMEQVYFNYQDDLWQMENLIGTQGLEIMELLDQMEDWTDEFCFKSAAMFNPIPARENYMSLKIQPKCGERPEPVPKAGNVNFYFRLTNLCGVSFVSLNNESYAGLGLMIKKMMPTKYTSIDEVAFGHCGYIPDTSMEWVNGFGTCLTNAWDADTTEKAYREAMEQLRAKVYGE